MQMNSEKDYMKGLSLRCDEVQEIMSKPPHWMLRWGILTIAIIILGLTVGSFFIRYDEKLSVVAVVENNISIVNIIVPTDGTLQHIYVMNGENITCGDTLFTYYPKQINSQETSDSLCAILSPTDGIVSYPYTRTAGMSLKAKSIFIDIVPQKLQDYSIHTYGFLSESDLCKATTGQMVRIPIVNDVLLGTVGTISPLPNDKGLYYYDIALSPKSEKLIMGRKTPFHKEYSAEIIISCPRLINKIFASFTNW